MRLSLVFYVTYDGLYPTKVNGYKLHIEISMQVRACY